MYWRRRFAFLASMVALVVLIVLTVRVLMSGSSTTPTASGRSSGQTPPASHSQSHPHSSPHPSTSAQRTSHSASTSTSKSPSRSTSSSVAPKKCTDSQLSLSAASNKSSYSVGEQPVLSIVVKNVASVPCVQDLADPQIVLRVYNGESRVWGSHDCKIEPGTNDQTLMAGSSVRVSIVWSGLSSQPSNCNNRQRAGAGTYTLYASLAGREGTAAQFTIR